MSLLNVFHLVLDYFLSWVHMAQNSEYGWKSFNRKTGRITNEKQPLQKKLKLLLLFNPLTEWIDTTHAMRLHIHDKSIEKGKEEASPRSKKQIRSFVNVYDINMDDFEPSDINAYSSFAEFFVRHHTPISRPIFRENDPSKAVVVADSRVVVFDSVAETKKLWVKGRNFSILHLAMDTKLGEAYADASVASFRLSPQDYHRYHSPVSGTVRLFRGIPGDYYQVDPVALHSDVDILSKNAREYVLIDTQEFGTVLFVAIGATSVGKVHIHSKWQEPGSKIRKGDELGYFQFGGSSIVVAFLKGRIKFDQDLLDLSRQQLQVSVEVGMSLGSTQ